MGRITLQLNYSVKKKTLHAAEKESDQGEPASQAGRLQKKRVEFWLLINAINYFNVKSHKK